MPNIPSPRQGECKVTDERIPTAVKMALIARDQARDMLHREERNLQAALNPFMGMVFTVEGVPVKVCGPAGKLYLRRIVGPDKAAELRKKWRSA